MSLPHRIKRAGLVGLLAALIVVLIPGPGAWAVDPPPPPVTEVPDIPSRVVKSATGSPMGDKTLLILRSMANGTWTLPASSGTVATTSRVITAPAAVARAAGGSMVLPFYIGYAIGAGGLQVYAAATGTTYTSLQCSTPGWYQAASDFISAGLQPDCAALVAEAQRNLDQAATLTGSWSSPGGSVVVLGSLDGWTDTTKTTAVKAPCARVTVNSGWSRTWNYSLGASQTTNSAFIGMCWDAYPLAGGGPDYSVQDLGWYLSPFVPRGINFTKPGSPTYTFDPTTALTASRPDPNRTPSCRIKWRDGTTTTGTGTAYKETTGIPTSASGLGCKTAWDAKPGAGPAGVMPEKISIDSQPDGGAKTEISTGNVPDFTTAEKQAMVPGSGNGHGLVLEKVTGAVVESCMTWEADCANWWTATSAGTVPTVGTSTYRCTFGGAPLALVECGIYRHTFDTRTSTPVVTDPVTGTDTPWITAPSTGVQPGNSINPGVGPGTASSPGDQCMASWPSAPDPLSWVFWPVRCALVWAFVPRATAVETAFSASALEWEGKPPAQIASIVENLTLTPASSGCSISVTILGATGNIIDVCSGPMALLPLFTQIITAGLVGIVAFHLVRRQIAGMVGYTEGQG